MQLQVKLYAVNVCEVTQTSMKIAQQKVSKKTTPEIKLILTKTKSNVMLNEKHIFFVLQLCTCKLFHIMAMH